MLCRRRRRATTVPAIAVVCICVQLVSCGRSQRGKLVDIDDVIENVEAHVGQLLRSEAKIDKVHESTSSILGRGGAVVKESTSYVGLFYGDDPKKFLDRDITESCVLRK